MIVVHEWIDGFHASVSSGFLAWQESDFGTRSIILSFCRGDSREGQFVPRFSEQKSEGETEENDLVAVITLASFYVLLFCCLFSLVGLSFL